MAAYTAKRALNTGRNDLKNLKNFSIIYTENEGRALHDLNKKYIARLRATRKRRTKNIWLTQIRLSTLAALL